MRYVRHGDIDSNDAARFGLKGFSRFCALVLVFLPDFAYHE